MSSAAYTQVHFRQEIMEANIVSPDQTAPLYCITARADTYIKTCLISHAQKDHKSVFKTNYRLMQAKSIAECSFGAFCNTLDLH